MMTHDQLVFLINQTGNLPADAHGRDYLVGMPVDGDTQTGEAFILQWHLPAPRPDEGSLRILWHDPQQPYQTQWQAGAARTLRDARLRELDAVIGNPLRWAEFTEPQQIALASYRQALLDVPQQSGFPADIDWPDEPGFLTQPPTQPPHPEEPPPAFPPDLPGVQ